MQNPSSVENKKNRNMPAWLVTLIFAIVLGFLGLLAWGLNNAQKGPIQVGKSVPDFTLTSFSGEVFNTAELKGNVFVVNFWASWCKPCEQEAAEMEQAWQEYKGRGDVIFFGVDYVDTETEAMEYINKYNITYPNGPDLRTKISQLFRIRGVPETYIIDKEGKLAAVKIGPYKSLDEIKMMIDPLLD